MSSSANWWADRLGAPRQPVPQQIPQYIPNPAYQPVQPPPQYIPNPAYQQPYSPGLPPTGPTQYELEIAGHALPRSATEDSKCPECRGNNYTKVGQTSTNHGTVDARRCFDCGWPLKQSGSGVLTQSSLPVAKAKQIANGGWNPTTIVDRI